MLPNVSSDLSSDREDRFPDAAAMIEELHSIGDEAPPDPGATSRRRLCFTGTGILIALILSLALPRFFPSQNEPVPQGGDDEARENLLGYLIEWEPEPGNASDGVPVSDGEFRRFVARLVALPGSPGTKYGGQPVPHLSIDQ